MALSCDECNRFSILILMQKFDNPNERDECRKFNLANPVSKLFGKFVSNCQAVYSIGCADKMLVSFHKNCQF